MAARQSTLLRLHFAAPQPLNMEEEVSHLHFSFVPCVKVPFCITSLMALLHAGQAMLAAADVL